MSHGHFGYRVLAPRSRFYQGPFGRLCPELPPAKVLDAYGKEITDEKELDAHFRDIADNRMSERPGEEPGDLLGDVDELEAEFSSNIPAGYTYFGQFIDHDITFDPTSMLMRRNDPDALLNFRTPRLDLDCIYGRGPADQPYLYTGDKKHMLIGKVADKGSELRDLPRNTPAEGDKARALIGDMRNDENSMVSQLQLAFLLAHNTLVDRAAELGVAEDEQFEVARQTLRWLYQWIVWHDFLKRVVLTDTWACAMTLESDCGRRKRWKCGFDDVYKWKHQPFMPVEFSVAAYRFGHSMVRNAYRTNILRGADAFVPIFANVAGTGEDDLRGFRPMERRNVIQWDWFLQMATSKDPFPQMARKIDTKLANALLRLHERAEPDHAENVLAFRNLKRGWTFDLPSGPDMARKFCIDPVPLEHDEPRTLWYYILREAEVASASEGRATLGALGSLILCAVFAGLLKGDPRSWVNMVPCWRPEDDPLLCPGIDNEDTADEGSWTLASIIRIAGLPVDDKDVNEQDKGTFPDTVKCVTGAGRPSRGGGGKGGRGKPGKSPGGKGAGGKGRHKDELWKKPGKER